MDFNFYHNLQMINAIVRDLNDSVGQGHLPFLLSRADHNQLVNAAGTLNRKAGQLQDDIEKQLEELRAIKHNLGQVG